jgi:branched-chain amino acid transport system substrate-binding protein
MKTRAGALVIAIVILTGACSVSTPRHESAAAVRAAGTRVNPNGSVSYDGTTDAAGAPVDANGQPIAATAGGNSAAASDGGGDSGAVAATSAGGDRTGVTSNSITFSLVAGFSGTLAPIVNKAWEAILTWEDDVNAAGGINGRKVIVKQVDHKETAAGGVAACKEVQSNGSFFAAVPEGVEANVTAVDCLDKAGIPTVYFASEANPNWTRAFADLITSAQAGTIMASYIRNALGGAGKNVGVMYVNQAAYSDIVPTLQSEANNIGLKIVDTESVEPNQASFTSQLLKMKNAGVQILVVSATTEAIGIVRDARGMGWDVPITGWGYEFDFVTAAAHDLFKGVTGLRSYAPVDVPAYDTYRQHMDARGRNRDDRTADLEGFVTYGRALLYGEMLQRAGTDPTRESLIAGIETITNYDNGIIPPISYSNDRRIGADAAFPVECCNSDYTWHATDGPRSSF